MLARVSLSLDIAWVACIGIGKGVERGVMRRGAAYHGIPSRICSWTTRNWALIPNTTLAATSIVRIQKFSCISGQ